MHFERGNSDIKATLSLGGYSFDTLRCGSILLVTQRFGLSKEEGKIRDFHECWMQVPRGSWLLVTRIIAVPNKKDIHFLLFTNEEDAIKNRGILERGEAFPGWRTKGHIGNSTKRIFDFRLKVITPGF